MQIYQLNIYYNQGNLDIEYRVPKKLLKFQVYGAPLLFNLFIFRYLQTHPNLLADEEIEVSLKRSERRLDVESINPFIYCTSERFKQFAEQEKLSLNFFPTLVEGERRYLIMGRGLPIISDYEMDIKKSEYYDDGYLVGSRKVFRSDIIEYYGYQMFSMPTHTYEFVTDQLKERFEANDFLFSYEEIPVTQTPMDIKSIEKDLKFAREMERKIWLIGETKKRYQQLDDYLEKILIEEGDEASLHKFRTEYKGIWKKDFERYEQGVMGPLEKITYW